MCNSPLVLANGFPDDKRYILLFHEIKVLPQHLFECVKPCHIPSFLSEPTNPFRLQKRQLYAGILVQSALPCSIKNLDIFIRKTGASVFEFSDTNQMASLVIFL